MAMSDLRPMPSLDGATGWLNSEPLSPAELRGHVVLVDFWTFTCINWLRTEPYVRAWSRAYRDDGLVVIGVHTPEFSFEHEIDRVRQATKERGIDYPVAVDNDYEIWSAFDNHYWPALYFVDIDGIIRDHHFGEGRYEQSERVIQRLLGVEREPVSVEGVGVEAEADWTNLRTPETYLGYGRGERFASPDGAALDERRAYQLPERLRLNQWALAGEWTIGRERVVLDEAGGTHRLPVPRAGRASRRVSRSAGSDSLPGAPRRRRLPAPPTACDVDADGNGVLRDGRLYQLVRAARRGPRADAGDHVPGARRRGVRVHVRVAGHRSRSCWPPSMSKAAPVTAVLVIRWTASAAMSAGPTTRPIGSVVRSCSRRASSWSPRIAADSGVSTNPAAIRFTRIGASSSARFRVSAGIAAVSARDQRARAGATAAGAADEEQGASRANLAHRVPGDLQRQQEMGVEVLRALSKSISSSGA